MDSTAHPILYQFVNAYFHQDWDLDHGTETEVIADYIRTTWRDDVEQTIAQIDQYMRDHPTGLLATFDAEFEPMIIIGENDDEARAWLIRARDQMQSDLMYAPSRPR
jgi:hypothetical protein